MHVTRYDRTAVMSLSYEPDPSMDAVFASSLPSVGAYAMPHNEWVLVGRPTEITVMILPGEGRIGEAVLPGSEDDAGWQRDQREVALSLATAVTTTGEDALVVAEQFYQWIERGD